MATGGEFWQQVRRVCDLHLLSLPVDPAAVLDEAALLRYLAADVPAFSIGPHAGAVADPVRARPVQPHLLHPRLRVRARRGRRPGATCSGRSTIRLYVLDYGCTSDV